MEFIQVGSYNNYMDANIILGRLQEEGVECWLKDENISTIMPIWNMATGGIRLMVVKDDVETAVQLLKGYRDEQKAKIFCPYCNSSNIELISSPRKVINWISAVTTFFLGDYAMAVDQQYHCFNCKKEFKKAKENEDPVT